MALVMLRHLLPPCALCCCQLRGFLQQKHSWAIVGMIGEQTGKDKLTEQQGVLCFRKSLFGKNKSTKSGGLLGFFKSRVEFLSKNREKTTSQNYKQLHRDGIPGGLPLKSLPLTGVFPRPSSSPTPGAQGLSRVYLSSGSFSQRGTEMLCEKIRKAFSTQLGHADSSPRSCCVVLRFSQQLTERDSEDGYLELASCPCWHFTQGIKTESICILVGSVLGLCQLPVVLEQLLDTNTSLGCPAWASWPPLVAKAEARGSLGGVVMLSAQCQRAEWGLTCSETLAQHWEGGDGGCSGCSLGAGTLS